MTEENIAPGVVTPVNRSETMEEAERMAYLEKQARDLELTLKNEREGEKSKLQKENIKTMNVLLERYPHAFEEIVGEKGGRVLLIREQVEDSVNASYILTENGVFRVIVTDTKNGGTWIMAGKNEVDYVKVADKMGDIPGPDESTGAGKNVFLSDVTNKEEIGVYARRVIFNQPNDWTSEGFKRRLVNIDEKFRMSDAKDESDDDAAKYSMGTLV